MTLKVFSLAVITQIRVGMMDFNNIRCSSCLLYGARDGTSICLSTAIVFYIIVSTMFSGDVCQSLDC
jgi:hypothetical protein